MTSQRLNYVVVVALDEAVTTLKTAMKEIETELEVDSEIAQLLLHCAWQALEGFRRTWLDRDKLT